MLASRFGSLAGALAAIAAFPPPGAAAEAARVRFQARLDYQVEAPPGSCPGLRALHQAVASHLGYDPFRREASLQVSCLILAASGSRPRAIIDVFDSRTGSRGRRELVGEDADCVDLARAAALAIAIAIDPLLDRPASPALSRSRAPALGRASRIRAGRDTRAASTAPGDDRSSRPIREPDPAAPVESAVFAPMESPGPGAAAAPPKPETEVADRVQGMPLPAAAAPSSLPWRFTLGGGPAVALGLQPAAALGLQLAVAARLGRFSFGLESQLHAAGETGYRGGTVSGRVLTGTVAGCVHARQLLACALAAGGGLRGAARDFADSRRDLTAFAGAGARLAWQKPVGGGWSIVVQAGILIPLLRTTLWIGDTAVWTAPRIAGQGALLGVYAFP